MNKAHAAPRKLVSPFDRAVKKHQAATDDHVHKTKKRARQNQDANHRAEVADLRALVLEEAKALLRELTSSETYVERTLTLETVKNVLPTRKTYRLYASQWASGIFVKHQAWSLGRTDDVNVTHVYLTTKGVLYLICYRTDISYEGSARPRVTQAILSEMTEKQLSFSTLKDILQLIQDKREFIALK